MSDPDAEAKFRQATLTFSALLDRMKTQGPFSVPAREFQGVRIDLDAALHGLTGVMKGRALVMKAHALMLWHEAKNDSLLFVPPPRSLLEEGLASAAEGRKILAELGDAKNLPWADEIVESFRH